MYRDRHQGSGASHRNSLGQFDERGSPIPEHEKLQNAVGCKISGHELRRYTKLFDVHRRNFGWECMSDMYRDMLNEGCRTMEGKITHLDPALIAMREQSDERERAQERGLRHTEFERTINVVEEELEILNRNKDYGGIRGILKEFVDRTRRIKDPVIRDRRAKEFERRGWAKMYAELNRGVSLDPKDMTHDED